MTAITHLPARVALPMIRFEVVSSRCSRCAAQCFGAGDLGGWGNGRNEEQPRRDASRSLCGSDESVPAHHRGEGLQSRLNGNGIDGKWPPIPIVNRDLEQKRSPLGARRQEVPDADV
jgi:hypothetical protein